MIDNFELIQEFIKKNSKLEKNDFFFIQIIKRRKDNLTMSKSDINIENLYLSFEEIDKYKSKIIDICKINNARSIIRLEKRNFEKIAKETNYIIADNIRKGEYKAVKNAYNSACGQFSSETKSLWMIDIDDSSILDEVSIFVKQITKIHLVVPSKSGYHLIISGFNPILLNDIKVDHYDLVELKKDSVTNLYIN